jgi:protein O-mannosyl-transferase
MKIRRFFIFTWPFVFCLVAVALFHEGFGAPWYYDSALLQENEQIFAHEGLWGVVNLFPQRPVPMMSFFLNYLVAGMDPFSFRAVNAVLLGLTASGVAVSILLLLETPALANRASSTERTWLAFLIGAVFLVHPIQTYLVLYVWQRMALLACFFSIGAFAVYLGVRTAKIRPAATGYALCFTLFALAAMSKENAITLPAVLVLVEVAFFRPGRRELLVRATINAACLLVLVGILALFERPHGTQAQSAGIVNTLAAYYQEGGLTVTQVFITQCRLLFAYVSIITVPLPSKVLLVTPQVIYGSLRDSAASTAAVAAACSLPFVAVYLLRRRPLTGFGILFFIINLMPEAFLVPQYLFFTYRAVLPMVGLFLVLVDGILGVLKNIRDGVLRLWVRWGVVAALSVVIVVMGLITRSKAELWADPVRLWTEVVDNMPPYRENVEKRATVNALNNLGIALQKAGSASDAAYFHRLAVNVDPLNGRSHVLLGKAYIRDGKLAEAVSAMRDALDLVPHDAEARMGLAVILMQQNQLAEAVVQGKKAVELAPENARYHNDLGVMLLKQGEFREAAAHFARATALYPGFVRAHYLLGKALLAEGKQDEAIGQFLRTLNLKPDHVSARNDLAAAFAQSGRVEEAIFHLRAILTANPNDSVAQTNLHNLLSAPRRNGQGKPITETLH